MSDTLTRYVAFLREKAYQSDAHADRLGEATEAGKTMRELAAMQRYDAHLYETGVLRFDPEAAEMRMALAAA